MKITEKGFYRTKNNKVVLIYHIFKRIDEEVTGTLMDSGDVFTWYDNGKVKKYTDHEHDLVELIKPYSEELLK